MNWADQAVASPDIAAASGAGVGAAGVGVAGSSESIEGRLRAATVDAR